MLPHHRSVHKDLKYIVTGDPLHSRALAHSRAPIVDTAVPRENNGGTAVWTMGHGCVQVRGCVEGHPWLWRFGVES